MRRLLLTVGLLLAACSGGAEAQVEVECAADDLACALLDQTDLEVVLGEQVEITGQIAQQVGSTVSWCDSPLPVPVERYDASFAATSAANGVTITIGATALRYDGADAEVTIDSLQELRQGCAWQEGDVEFRFIDEVDVADFGDEAIGLLIRVVLGSEEENTEIVLVRRGPVIAQVGLFPAQESPVIWDALGRRLDQRLVGVVG